MAKEIIIDGVDVNKCEHSFKQFDNWAGKDILSCDCVLGFRCEPRKNNCKFYMNFLEKQLKRAEQKLEEIKEIIMPIKKYTCMERHCDTIDRILEIIEGEENE